MSDNNNNYPLAAQKNRILSELSARPGVYLYKNTKGDIIYVGKAQHLKKRVSSYFQFKQLAIKTKRLMEQAVALETIVTNSELEALILESNLIKHHRPRYNVLFRDDKSYPYIVLSQDEYPRLSRYRGKRKIQQTHFGPFPSTLAVRTTLNLLQKLFKVRQCENSFFNNRTRPCLQYQIKRCKAPCVGLVSQQEYQQDVTLSRLFLQGKSDDVIQQLHSNMQAAAAIQDYEQAANYRDQIQALRHIVEQQYVSGEKVEDSDMVALVRQHGQVCVCLLQIRDGRLLGSQHFFPSVPPDSLDQEVLSAFITQYYSAQQQQQAVMPYHIITNCALKDSSLANLLASYAGHRLQISHKVRANRAQYLALAVMNAEEALSAKLGRQLNFQRANQELQNLLGLSHALRVECFDISHSQGAQTIASCVVFDEQGPCKQDYRRYNIQTTDKGDDYAAMREAITRRYRQHKRLPDVLLVDGGRGQLRQAQDVLDELAINQVSLLGLAKGDKRRAENDVLWQGKTRLPWQTFPLARVYLQQLRDEAHRFAITAHRQARAKNTTKSGLEQIAGVGPVKRQRLIQHFGGLQGVKKASVNDLLKVNGINHELALRIYNDLH